MKKIPETREEWIKYGNISAKAKLRRIPVIDIPLDNIEMMWNYKYQAKYHKGDMYSKELKILASDSLINLKKEIKNRKWKDAYLTSTEGCFSHGQFIVDEYHYIPIYR